MTDRYFNSNYLNIYKYIFFKVQGKEILTCNVNFFISQFYEKFKTYVSIKNSTMNPCLYLLLSIYQDSAILISYLPFFPSFFFVLNYFKPNPIMSFYFYIVHYASLKYAGIFLNNHEVIVTPNKIRSFLVSSNT